MTTKNKQEKAMQGGGTLERALGSTATTRILDFLFVNRRYDYAKQDIARYSDVSPRHATIAINKLEKFGIIKNTRNVGHANMYQFDIENKASDLILKLANTLAFIESENLTEEDFVPENQTQGQIQRKECIVEIPA